MKAREIAEAFRAQFAADIAFSAASPAIACRCEQTGDDATLPRVDFEASTKAMNGTGSALSFTLLAVIESTASRAVSTDPDPAIAHAARVELVRAKLLTTGKAALLAALNLPLVLDFRGWNASESDPAIEGDHFKTPIAISGTVLIL